MAHSMASQWSISLRTGSAPRIGELTIQALRLRVQASRRNDSKLHTGSCLARSFFCRFALAFPFGIAQRAVRGLCVGVWGLCVGVSHDA